MSEVQNTQNQPSELELLKSRAKMMGISFSGNIGLEALKVKVAAKMAGEPVPPDASDAAVNALEVSAPAGPVTAKPETKQELMTRLRNECMALVRVRITNMDPKKKDLPGEIFTVGNKYIGTIRKFIPYGEVTEAGYHIPKILYDELNSRRFLNIRTSKKAGQIHVEHGWAKEFSLEVLEPLTKQDLARLAAAQAAAGTFAHSGSSV
jgi:hypothetical protein